MSDRIAVPTLTDKTFSQIQTLERRIIRLQSRLDRLQQLSKRYILARLIVFTSGVVLVGTTWFVFDRLIFYLSLALAVFAFLIIVTLHRRLDGWIARYSIWIELYKDQLARCTLDWANIPLPSTLPQRNRLDIDLDLTGPRSLHHLLDQAVSQEGSQRLAGWLIDPVPDQEKIVAHQRVVQELRGMALFRRRLRLNLRLISTDQLRGERLLDWLNAELPGGRLVWLMAAGILLTVLDAVLFVLYWQGSLPPVWIVSLVGYLFFYYANLGRLGAFLESIIDLDRELDKFNSLLRLLETYPMGKQPFLASLCEPFRRAAHPPSQQISTIKWIAAGIGVRSNPFICLLLNLAVPWDFIFAYLASKQRERAAKILPAWLDTWYEVDALACLGDFAEQNPATIFPTFDPEASPIFQAAGLGHPLIPSERRVCNDFTLHDLGEVILVTGSNMSGKSTFIKTIGINLALAYAGAPVCAASLNLRPLRLYTCMRISDSITDGFSYFYAEVKALRGLLEALKEPNPYPLLYLVDEIFRGTNNRERLTGSRAYLKALIGAHGAGLIATHDLELASLAEQDKRVLNFHFRDEIQAGRLVFDYHVRPGPSQTTNALKIMEMEGLPVDE